MTRCDRQRGATLIVALILLMLLTLLVLSAYQTSLVDLKSAGNMQARTEALNAAQQAIETTISSPQFVATPANALSSPCGAPNTFCADYDGDGSAEYTVRLDPAPACVSMRTIEVVELNLSDAEDLGCAVGQTQQFGVSGADVAAGDSLCANTTWQITAQASSAKSGAKVAVSQGVGMRIAVDDMSGACL